MKKEIIKIIIIEDLDFSLYGASDNPLANSGDPKDEGLIPESGRSLK